MIPLPRIAGRILRWIGLVAGSLVLAALLLFALAFAINWRDEPLTPQARSLLTPPANSLKPEDNIYLAMAGFTAPSGVSVTGTGQARIERYNERLDAVLHDPSAQALAALNAPDPQALMFAGQAEFVHPLSGSVWNEVAAHRADIEALIAQNAELYQRYQALERLPGYCETARPSYLAPQVYVPTEVRYLFLEGTALRLRSGSAGEQREALSELLADIALWRRVLTGEGLLISKLLSLAYLQSDLLVLADLIADSQAQLPVGEADAEVVAPLFAPGDFSLAAAFAAELRVQASLLEQTQYLYTIAWSPQPAPAGVERGALDRLGSAVSGHFFKLNATVNLLAQQVQRLDSIAPGPGIAATDRKLSDSSSTAWSAVGVYNPIGRLLAGLAAPMGVNYPLRAWDVAALQRLVRAGYEIRRRQIAKADIPAFLSQHPEWATHPGDGRPFVWNPDALEIRVQTIGEQPAGRRFSIRVWQPAAPGAGRLAPPAPPR
jgi:hypothetical protein